MINKYVQGILNSHVYEAALETPLTAAHFLSKRLQNNVLIKREDMQPVFSFKLRGAYNCMRQLSDAERLCGVVTASAGNHAQGVAFASRALNISAKIVMPATTPEIKVVNVRERGGEVVLFGDNFDQALQEALRIQKAENRTFIHPYDDEHVITGQGTVGMEILRQHSDPIKAIFIPVGGGGLLAGIAAYVKYLRDDIQIIAVESEESACLEAALKSGSRVRLDRVGIFADGVAVGQIGDLPFQIARDLVDDVITVTNDEMCAAVKDLFEDTRTIAEPSGALSLAGLKKYVQREGCSDENLICIMSGANMDFSRLQFISDRAEVGEKREGIFSVRIPEQKGSFKTFLDVLAGHNITEFCYRYADNAYADILAGVRFRNGQDERRLILRNLTKAGYTVLDLTDDEITKSHVSHMVGGHLPPHAPKEYIFQISFPERPGTLANFLDRLNAKWNLSLFHYRNHGSLEGKVLLGFQCQEPNLREITDFLDSVGYDYMNVSDNAAYHQFLC